jgi:uncharacterized NAD(P)/FAD-binding protein YdhS
MRIGVVGAGAAGAALLTHLSAAAASTWAGSEIWLFDEPANLGRGMAFGEALDAARINTRLDRLDLRSADLLPFAKWSGSRGADVFDWTTIRSRAVYSVITSPNTWRWPSTACGCRVCGSTSSRGG